MHHVTVSHDGPEPEENSLTTVIPRLTPKLHIQHAQLAYLTLFGYPCVLSATEKLAKCSTVSKL